MIKFNNTLSYGLRLLVNLALEGKNPKQLKKIAKEENISLSYLRKLIIPLEKNGIVKSLRGPGGGFLLSRKPAQISLYEVINTLSHSKVIACVKGSSSCRRYGDCAVKDLLEEVYLKVQSVFKNKTLASIIKRRIR
jgi:Rrf2 family iron-sulfur cluster assembly transcriptional regulator